MSEDGPSRKEIFPNRLHRLEANIGIVVVGVTMMFSDVADMFMHPPVARDFDLRQARSEARTDRIVRGFWRYASARQLYAPEYRLAITNNMQQGDDLAQRIGLEG